MVFLCSRPGSGFAEHRPQRTVRKGDLEAAAFDAETFSQVRHPTRDNEFRPAPVEPETAEEMQAHGRKFPPNHLHETWHDWLYWDIELEG